MKKKVIILITVICYITIGCYFYGESIKSRSDYFVFSFDCEYDKENLCNLLLSREKAWLEKEFERLQIKRIDQKEENKQITYILYKITGTQSIRIKELVGAIDTCIKAKIKEQTSSSNLSIALSIDEEEFAKNFVEMLTLKTLNRFDSILGPVGLKNIEDIDSKVRFNVYIQWPIKALYKMEPFLLTPLKMDFKRVKYLNTIYDHKELKDDEEEIPWYCLWKKPLISIDDIQFIHLITDKYNISWWLDLDFYNKQRAEEIFNDIRQSPYRRILFLVDRAVYVTFDRNEFRFDNDRKIRIDRFEGEKTIVEKMVRLIRYGEFDVSLKVIKNSKKVTPTISYYLYQARILFYPIFWFKDWSWNTWFKDWFWKKVRVF